MTPKPSLLRAHYARLARLWPADPLRPHLPFQRVLLARRDDAVLADPTPSASPPSPSPSPDGGAAPGREARLETADDALARHGRAVNALYALLDDRFARKVPAPPPPVPPGSATSDRNRKQYPLPPHLLEPESNPAHYTRLIEDIAAAPGRSQATGLWIWLKGKVRFG
jgi:cytochrome b pre-mRNA-processing protein 6